MPKGCVLNETTSKSMGVHGINGNVVYSVDLYTNCFTTASFIRTSSRMIKFLRRSAHRKLLLHANGTCDAQEKKN